MVEKQTYLSITKGEELAKAVCYLRSRTRCPQVVSLGWDLPAPGWCPALPPALAPPPSCISPLRTEPCPCHLVPDPPGVGHLLLGGLSPEPLPLPICHVESVPSVLALCPLPWAWWPSLVGSPLHSRPPYFSPPRSARCLLLTGLACFSRGSRGALPG